MTAANLSDVRRDTRRLQAEARFRAVLEAAGLAAFVSYCPWCRTPYGVRLAEPCDDALLNVSDGICESCGQAQERADAQAGDRL